MSRIIVIFSIYDKRKIYENNFKNSKDQFLNFQGFDL